MNYELKSGVKDGNTAMYSLLPLDSFGVEMERRRSGKTRGTSAFQRVLRVKRWKLARNKKQKDKTRGTVLSSGSYVFNGGNEHETTNKQKKDKI